MKKVICFEVPEKINQCGPKRIGKERNFKQGQTVTRKEEGIPGK